MPGESFYTAPKALEHVASKLYEIDFPELKWREQIPTNNEVDPADAFYAFETQEFVGGSKVSNVYAKSAPRADVKTVKSSQLIVPLLGSFEYTLQNVREANKTGRDLPMQKARAARELVERGLDELFFMGSAKHGLEGLLNSSNVTSVNAANPGAGTAWSTKTTDQKIADIIDGITAIQDATNGREGNVVDILLPHAQYVDLSTSRVADTGMTSLAYVMSNIAEVRSIRSNWRLKNISGTDERMVLYTQDPDKVEAILPLDVLIHPSQEIGAIWDTLVEARAGGIAFYKPRSAYYINQI